MFVNPSELIDRVKLLAQRRDCSRQCLDDGRSQLKVLHVVSFVCYASHNGTHSWALAHTDVANVKGRKNGGRMESKGGRPARL